MKHDRKPVIFVYNNCTYFTMLHFLKRNACRSSTRSIPIFSTQLISHCLSNYKTNQWNYERHPQNKHLIKMYTESRLDNWPMDSCTSTLTTGDKYCCLYNCSTNFIIPMLTNGLTSLLSTNGAQDSEMLYKTSAGIPNWKCLNEWAAYHYTMQALPVNKNS